MHEFDPAGAGRGPDDCDLAVCMELYDLIYMIIIPFIAYIYLMIMVIDWNRVICIYIPLSRARDAWFILANWGLTSWAGAR